MTTKHLMANELDALLHHFDNVLAELNAMHSEIKDISTDDLVSLHNTWLRLYQAGQDIAFVAESLDAPYQSQLGDDPS